jgi:branched-chain amino acid transport system substrate-binding protein
MSRTRILSGTLVAVLLAACTANAPPAASPESSTAAAASAAPSVAGTGLLKIGVLVPFTESAIDSDIGASQRRAADLYLKLQGGKLGGRDVQLVYNDESLLDPATNDVRIRQFLDQDHVELLLGGASTPGAYQLRNAADAAKVVYIDTNATGNALTRTTSACTPSCKSRFVFRGTSTSWQMSEPLGEWVSKNGQKDFYLAVVDDAFGSESAAGFTEGLAKNGGRATGRIAVPSRSGAAWAKIVAGIKAQPTKSVFAAFVTDDAERFIAAWDAAGMRAAGYRLYGPGPLADAQVLKVARDAGLGITTSFQWSTEIDNPENKTFNDEFKKAYKDEDTGQPLAPDDYAAEMWDTMRVLDAAITATKGDTKNTDALIAALESVSIKTPAGAFAFDTTTHNPIEDVYIREVKTSSGALVNAVVDKIANVKDPGP